MPRLFLQLVAYGCRGAYTGTVSAKLNQPFPSATQPNENVSPSALFGSCSTDTGYDYSGHDVVSAPADSADTCCGLCNANAACQFYSFATDVNACFMKSSNAGRSPNPDRISGSRSNYSCAVESGFDYSGYDIGTAAATSAEQCCSICSNNANCSFFSYETDGTTDQACLMKTSNAGRQPNPSRVSGSCNGPLPSPSPSPAPAPAPSSSPLPAIPDKLWFGVWGSDPSVFSFSSLVFDNSPDDDTINQYGGPQLRFLYPAYQYFCQENAMTGACTLFSDYQARFVLL